MVDIGILITISQNSVLTKAPTIKCFLKEWSPLVVSD